MFLIVFDKQNIKFIIFQEIQEIFLLKNVLRHFLLLNEIKVELNSLNSSQINLN